LRVDLRGRRLGWNTPRKPPRGVEKGPLGVERGLLGVERGFRRGDSG